MRKITVAFCISNLTNGSLSVYDRLKKERPPYINIRADRCLGYCGLCVNSFYALVEHELVEAETPDELYDKIIIQLSLYLQ